MKTIHWLAAFVLAFELPVPLYWVILHSRIAYWRKHARYSYWVALLAAWGLGDGLLYDFRRQLFAWHRLDGSAAFYMTLAAGLALIAVDVFTFFSVEFELGGSRLVGHAEVTGRRDLATRGLYTRMRHPRYAGMIAAVVGVAVLANSRTLWIVVFFWCGVALATIALEERELHARFGAAYGEYAQRVPALFPFRFGAGHK